MIILNDSGVKEAVCSVKCANLQSKKKAEKNCLKIPSNIIVLVEWHEIFGQRTEREANSRLSQDITEVNK